MTGIPYLDQVGRDLAAVQRPPRSRFRMSVTGLSVMVLGLAALAFVTVSLVPGLGFASNRPVEYAPGEAEFEIDMVVFIDPGATSDTLNRVRAVLEDTEGVVAFVYYSSDDTWEEFQLLFADQPDIIESIVDPSTLGSSFRIGLSESADIDTIVDTLIRVDGVKDVMVRPALLDTGQ